MKRASKIFSQTDNFSETTLNAYVNSINRGWLTRQYFSLGKHDLVLPAWVNGILGPDGEGMHSVAGDFSLTNTDLRSYYAPGSLILKLNLLLIIKGVLSLSQIAILSYLVQS